MFIKALVIVLFLIWLGSAVLLYYYDDLDGVLMYITLTIVPALLMLVMGLDDSI